MNKILLGIPLFFICSLNSFCQELNGIYGLTYAQSDEANATYLSFNKGSFIYFELGSSTTVVDGANELKVIGTGKYNFKNNLITLNFKTDTTLISPYIYDSVAIFFSSRINQKAINIVVEYNNLSSNIDNASLRIETASNEYVRTIKNNSQETISLPHGTIIKAITISLISMPLKYLPFDINYNNLKYSVFAKDKKSPIKIVNNQILKFEITKYIGKDSIYIFGKRQFLRKVDKKELEYLNNLGNGEEPRLNKILNYRF
jgi:hypothetical protein